MALRFDATGDRLERTANLPSATAVTVWGLARIQAYRGAGLFSQLCEFVAADTTSGFQIYVFDTGSMELWNGVTTTAVAFGAAPAAGTWFEWALINSGTGANNLQAMWRALGSTTWNTVSLTGSTFTPAFLTIGNSQFSGGSFGDFFNGRMAAIKVWDVALTQAQLEQETWAFRAMQRASLNIETPCIDQVLADNLIDYSGNGRNWTSGGTLTVEDGPPITWTLGRRRPNTASAVVSAINAESSAGLPLGGSASAAVEVQTQSVKALPLGGSAAAAVLAQAASAAPLPFEGSTATAVLVQAASSALLPLGGSATVSTATGAFADSNRQLPLGGSIAATVLVQAISAAALPFAGAASGILLVRGTSNHPLPLAGAIAAAVLVQAASVRTLPLGGFIAVVNEGAATIVIYGPVFDLTPPVELLELAPTTLVVDLTPAVDSLDLAPAVGVSDLSPPVVITLLNEE